MWAQMRERDYKSKPILRGLVPEPVRLIYNSKPIRLLSLVPLSLSLFFLLFGGRFRPSRVPRSA